MSFFHKCLKTGKILKERKCESLLQTEIKIQQLFEGYKDNKKLNTKDKIKKLHLLRNIIHQKQDDISNAITLSMGKIQQESKAEVQKTLNHIDFYIKNGENFLKTHHFHDAQKNIIKTYLKPMGVIYKIAPFNFPLWIGMKPAIAGLLLGNPTIIKNTPQCLLLSEIQEEIFQNEDLKQDLAIAYNNIDDTEKIIQMHQIKGVTFTGSVEVGKLIGEYAGRYFKRTVLELGGSDSFVVTKSANLKIAAKQLFEARMLNQGQVCLSPKRVLIQQDKFDEFIQELKQNFESYYYHHEEVYMSSHQQWQQVVYQVSKALENGDELLYGEMSEKQGVFNPLLIQAKDENSILMKEEVFGPVFVVYSYEKQQDMIELTNESDFGLGFSIYDQDIKKTENLSQFIKSGSFFVNEPVRSLNELPWGGVKNSGFGRDNGYEGLESFALIKTTFSSKNQ